MDKVSKFEYLIEASADIGTKDGPCLLWPYSVDKRGYGQLYHPVTKKPARAHREAFQHYREKVPSTIDVCHHCDVRICHRVSHLFAGDRLANVRDCIEKGRFRLWDYENHHRGEQTPWAKLKDADIPEIFRLSSIGVSNKQIGSIYEVTATAIYRILNRKSWKHVQL